VDEANDVGKDEQIQQKVEAYSRLLVNAEIMFELDNEHIAKGYYRKPWDQSMK
jgi:ubiquinone/menaquinone biosynthesis C-methylase UbiE